MGGRYRDDELIRDSLPPRKVWIHDPRVDGLLETPTRNGIVDIDELVATVKSTVASEYDWTSTLNDVHHLQWIGAHYTSDLAREFRELPQRKMFIPRVFHNQIHYVTLPPPVPSEEVMRHYLEAQRVAINLSHTAALATRLLRTKKIPKHRLLERQQQEFEKYTIYIENARLVPREFSLLAIDEIQAQSHEDLPECSKRLGKLALHLIPRRMRAITA